MKVYIFTLGCKANHADSDSLARQLATSGLKTVDSPEEAGVCIINTCTVTGKAAYQSRQIVRHIIKNNPTARVIVTGCDTEFERDVLEKIDGVSLVVLNKDRDNILNIINNDLTSDEIRDTRYEIRTSGRARPLVKIQDGCENFCSYCIVPYTRGKLWSMPAEDVVGEIKRIVSNGFYEAVLTGIHIGHYGRDTGEMTLTELLKKVLDETDIPRLRLSSIEPEELGLGIIGLIRESRGRICPHLHIPLQSGSDATLARMKRRYTTADYMRVVEFVGSVLPGAAIGADVITGFPGETDAEFQATYDFIESMPVTYLHVFTYSDREGTEASRMEGKIDEDVKRERTARLRELSIDKRTAYLESFIGREVTVVFDQKQVGGFWKGVSGNYITVLVKDRKEIMNHHRVKLVEVSGEAMTGTII